MRSRKERTRERTRAGASVSGDSAPVEAQAPCSGEIHIAGLVVYASPAHLKNVAGTISRMAGAEIHAVSELGKLVVTIEGNGSDEVANTLQAIHGLPGVYSAALVYQHHEDAESLNEELVDEADPPGIY
ncbi:chaperone NapD [Paraburkholderia dinghuensis]|uniref:Chaperone NapD n=1 Tax=Paraburkholderia dinghuensis TaxID=2305225 RepID=A0A3N6PUW0_9BURK|nr:chaperone NapD [Paraburkholderia dinghuensis]RQH03626.1 glutamate synthase [Paraburkholderia dinghuensis]